MITIKIDLRELGASDLDERTAPDPDRPADGLLARICFQGGKRLY
jgi:hypothetical protein